MSANTEGSAGLWGNYPDWHAVARFEYGRRMWRQPEMRVRLLAHWADERHPYRERFLENRELIESVLGSEAPVEELNEALRERNTSLRCVAREIPPVFGSFFTS